jgi:hypothetical protein
MTALKQLRESDPLRYAEQLANDASLRHELRHVVKYATVLARRSRGRSGIDALRVFGDREVQQNALALIRSLERALELLEPRASHRRRRTLLGVFAGLSAAGVVVAAKTAIAAR